MNDKILSVIIYGSRARKDHDNSSDLDICVITKGKIDKKYLDKDVFSIFPKNECKNLEISSYDTDLVNVMLDYGSLFLWHLKNEGEVVYGKNYFDKIIKNLSPYRHHADELHYHFEIFNDLKMAHNILKEPNEFDLSLLFTICRNTCMILSNKFESITFGRLSCYYSAVKLFKNIPLNENAYIYLSKWKNIYERNYNATLELPSLCEYEKLIKCTHDMLQFALNKIPNDV